MLRRFAPLFPGTRDPFQFSLCELFLSYHNRHIRNLFLRWAFEKGEIADDQSLPSEEFKERFGPPPWDILNETAGLIGLEYSFVPPEGIEETAQFEVKLCHNDSQAEVTTDLLSSGEKTLLLITMTLYTGSQQGEAIELPRGLVTGRGRFYFASLDDSKPAPSVE